ncbi:MAG TPA: hypothetical protein P5295_15275 [Spirochaetota bacterium]|nr:hypothetical protein [Spirochaetota bacterium]
MIKTLLAISAACAVIAAPLAAAHRSPVNAALLDFSSNRVPVDLVESVKNRVWFRLITADVVTMLEPVKTREAMITQNRDTIGYDDTAAAARIGHFLRADYVVFGTLDRVPSGGVVIYVRVADSESGAIVYADSESFTDQNLALHASDMLSGRLLKAFEGLRDSGVSPAPPLKGGPGFGLHLTGGYVHPLADFSDTAGPGWDVLAAPGIAYRGFFFGFRTGYIGCAGSGSTDGAFIVPLAAMILYSIELPAKFSVDLTFSGGFSYKSLEGGPLAGDGYGPLLMGGAYLGYRVHESVRLVLGTECGAVLERRDQVFLLVHAGFMFCFH